MSLPAGSTGKARAAAPDLARFPAREDALYIEAAWLYYHDGLNQNEIAARMRISRASVVNYLNEVRARDWVRVHLDSDVFRGHRLAAQLCARYGLAEALVVPEVTQDRDAAASVARVTRAAADWLPRLLEPGDRLGVSWGATVYQMARQVPHTPVPDLTVTQLLGSRSAALGFEAEACTSMLAHRLDGQCINLHVPLVLSSKNLRDALCDEPVVRDQLAALAMCNKTVLACGTCDADAHVVRSGILSAEGIAAYRAKGAAGVICGRLIDAEGRPMVAEVEERMIGVSLEQMRGKDIALLVAAGPGRAGPAQAAIKGGFVTHLVTSAAVAEELLGMKP
ncbi:sugar-binding transcriptional regulator [Roseobacter denitrificans]|uniref:Transcriptional regulator, putative n=1 Tax=Roseobacter denitrificans (strain ATCC 33942 / OCh 114) TaxID=375451 RepID=Q166Y8_ROSDO|nr:sugar-binding transcriptional regulator [Roseobacter denitrificans]ABG31955.1 transcriptional regulator, putative [Roseobacter denitrificans OCh 114]AVL51491.1 sugar-binding transcriptional regulator [Roseobacter denitrificans]SFG35204.1 DNA-binding transcriptional regulator LsrR, DeoR family [Roseobacter denitrificans OCh 114]